MTARMQLRDFTLDQLAVLVVDDEQDLVNSVKRILRLDGYRIDTAATLGEMMDRENWSDYFAILLDRRLPDGNADQCLAKIKELAPQAAIIMITAYAELDGALTALHHGAEDFFLKPVDPEHLRSRVKRLADMRLTESQLHHERTFAQVVLDTTRTLIVVTGIDGTILRVNKYLEELCGYREEELIGKNVVDALMPQEFAEEARRCLQQTFVGTYRQGSRHPLQDKAGRLCDIAWWNGLLTNERSEVTGLVCAGLDMTEYDRLQQKLIQSERLAAIGEAMAGLAHESRNALQRSQVCLDLLSEQVKDRADSLELLESVQRAQDDLYRLYEEVRAYAAPIHLRPERCDVGEILRQAFRNAVTGAPQRDVQLDEQFLCRDLHCTVDRFALGQVFRNIIENALQACPAEVRLTITYREHDVDGQQMLQVVVRDNGPGVSAEQAAHIFDSFFTTKTEGTGLGMAIARRIVEAHSGYIELNPQVECGAEFLVTLPRDKS